MVQVVKQQDFGQEVGEALGKGLEAFALQRLENLKTRKKGQAFQNLLGQQGNDQQAEQYGQLDSGTLNTFLKHKLAEPQQAAFAQALSQSVGGQDEQPMRANQSMQPEHAAPNPNAGIKQLEQTNPNFAQQELPQPKKQNVAKLDLAPLQSPAKQIAQQENVKKVEQPKALNFKPSPLLTPAQNLTAQKQFNAIQQKKAAQEIAREKYAIAAHKREQQEQLIAEKRTAKEKKDELIQKNKDELAKAKAAQAEQTIIKIDRLSKLSPKIGSTWGGLGGPNEEATEFAELLRELPKPGTGKGTVDLRPKITDSPKAREQKLKALRKQYQEILGENYTGPTDEPEQVNAQGQTPTQKVPRETGIGESIVYQAGQALKGLGEGVTGLAAAPFNLANLASGGRIPVPEAIQALEKLPEKGIKALGYKTEAPSENQKEIGDAISTFTSLISPSGALGLISKGAKVLGKSANLIDKVAKILHVGPKSAAAIAGAGQLAHWGAKKIGASEAGAQSAKLGAMVALPLIGARALPQFAKRAVNSAIPEAGTINAGGLNRDTNALIGELSAIKEPTSLMEKLTEQVSKLGDKEKSIKDIFNIEQTLNQISQDKESLKQFPNKHIFPQYTEAVEKSLELAGKEHSKFGQAYNNYNEFKKADVVTNKVADAYKAYLKYKAQNPLAKRFLNSLETFGVSSPLTVGLAKGLKGGIRTAAVGGAIASTALTAGEIARTTQLIVKSPAFRNALSGLYTAGVLGTASAINKAAEKFDKITAHEEKKK